MLFCSFYLLRYEDLVSDLVGQVKQLYAFMGVEFGEKEEALVRSHTGPDNSKKNPYYSTYRCVLSGAL